MSSDTRISVDWPPAPLSESGWRRRTAELASKAESLVGRPCSLQQTAELALELIGLAWPALGPETVAATARASLLLGVPVLMATAPADQFQEIADRLDQIWQQAQASPAAGVVQLPQPMLSEVRPDAGPPRARAPRRAKPADPAPDTEPAGVREQEPEPAPAAEDPDALPPAWLDYPEPGQHPVAALEPPAPDPLPVVITAEPEPPAPRRRPAPAPAPPGWFSAAEVAELLEVDVSSVGRWRKEGRLGAEGTGWQQCGRSFYFSPDAVENIDRTRIPSGLDQLVAEIQAP
jgi:hypothetical protein